MELYFKIFKVGSIKNKEADFPSYIGDLEYSKEYLESVDADLSEVKKYISLQARYCELYDTEADIPEGEINKINGELEKLTEISESTEWYLESGGSKQAIMCPIIYSNNEISWRS